MKYVLIVLQGYQSLPRLWQGYLVFEAVLARGKFSPHPLNTSGRCLSSCVVSIDFKRKVSRLRVSATACRVSARSLTTNWSHRRVKMAEATYRKLLCVAHSCYLRLMTFETQLLFDIAASRLWKTSCLCSSNAFHADTPMPTGI